MRPALVLRIALAAALLPLAGCSSSNKGQIEDTKWTSRATTGEGENASAEATLLQFDKDGKLTLKRGTETFQGTYSLGMGPTVTFHFEQDFMGRKAHAEKIVVNGDQLTMTDSDGTSLTFQRAK